MENQKYGIVKAGYSLPARDLLFPVKGKNLAVGFPAFGPNSYIYNLKDMQKQYFHSKRLPKISFREATTRESILAATYKFSKIAKPQILDLKELQVGRAVITPEGVFVNPPRAEKRTITNENKLKEYLNRCKKVNGGIWLYIGEDPNLLDFGFAPRETFKCGHQESEVLAKSGLARVLEHTEAEVAKNIKKITSSKNYGTTPQVWSFDTPSRCPVLRVIHFSSCDPKTKQSYLTIYGYYTPDDVGYAFGVLKKDND